MATISFVIDTKNLERRLTALERQALPAARTSALNTAAFGAAGTVKKLAQWSFDRPTPWLIRGTGVVEKATQANPVAAVYVRKENTAPNSPADYLRHHITGGQRFRKRSERLFERAGLLGRNESILPGPGVRLNRYGNVPAAMMVQIISQVKAFSEVGFKANQTRRSKAKNPRRRQFFAPNPRTRNKLKPGIYERYKGGVRPVLLFGKEATYRPRFDFVGAVKQDVNRRYGEAFKRALAREVRRIWR